MRGGRTIINSKPKPFISTWKTDNISAGSSATNQIALPLTSSGLYNFMVYWGDNTSSSISSSNQPQITHSYATAGTYNVTMSGYIKGWAFNSVGDRLKLLSISQWGCLNFTDINLSGSLNGAFIGCGNLMLSSSISDTPNFKGVTNIGRIFQSCSILSNVSKINQWDLSKITQMRSLFASCPQFDDNIGNWNVSNATDMQLLFNSTGRDGKFNNSGSDSIKNWDTSKVTLMNQMFTGQPFFNQPIGSWNTGNVINMRFMFYSYVLPRSGGLFNQPLNSWDTSKVTSMESMFNSQRMFNQNIGSWNTSNVTNMSAMFLNANFDAVFNNGSDSSIKNWDTSKVTNFSFMFQGQPFFNQEIGLWNLSSSLNITQMFAGYASPRSASMFNNSGSDSIKNWSLGNSTSSFLLFSNQTSFNQPIGSWDMSKITNIQQMFAATTERTGSFNQNIGSWNVSLVTVGTSFMANRTLNDFSTTNYDALLNGWASRAVRPSVSINFGTIKYTSAASASRAILTGAPNSWTIVDGGIA